MSTKEFFERFEKDRASLELRLANIRHVTKLFARRNSDRDPTVVADLRRFCERRLTHLKRLQRLKKPVKA